MDIPDISGYRLDKALSLLRSLGCDRTDVRLTAAPRLREAGYDGSARVVRYQLMDNGVIEILVCNSDISNSGI